MNELKLIRELTSLESKKETLEIRIKVWVDNTNNAEFKKRLIEVKREITRVSRQLGTFSNNSACLNTRSRIISHLQAYTAAMSIQNSGYNRKVSRSQGFVQENALLGYILSDIKTFVSGRDSVSQVFPLYNSSTERGSINKDELTFFLNNEIQRVADIRKVNYNKLRDFYEGFRKALLREFGTRKVHLSKTCL